MTMIIMMVVMMSMENWWRYLRRHPTKPMNFANTWGLEKEYSPEEK